MMRTPIIICLIILFLPPAIFGQELSTIEASVYHSTFLYFPSEIISIDIGLNDEYDATFNGKELKVTALKEDVKYQTNLTISTEEALYGFIISYSKKPKKLYNFIEKEKAIRILKETKTPEDIQKVYTGQQIIPIEKYNGTNDPICEKIYNSPLNKIVNGVSSGKVFAGLEQVYIHENRLYFKLILENSSNINYDVEFIKFRINDKKKIKKGSVQEKYMDILYNFNPVSLVRSEEKTSSIFVIEKFTIPAKKILNIEVQEKGGSRNLSFPIDNKQLLKASKI